LQEGLGRKDESVALSFKRKNDGLQMQNGIIPLAI